MNRQRFYELKKLHDNETMFLSFHKNTPAYQEVIDAGYESVPYIMEDWENSEDKETFHWFHALHEITGENPIPDKDRGKILKMKHHWLNWYKNGEEKK
tara:strand:- start:194 stop:487 length:294 start_codon:yes stop_codon:yes gene_type:complete